MPWQPPRDPEHRTNLLTAAVACITRGDPAAAETIAVQMLADLRDVAALHIMALARMGLGDLVGAASALREALALEPDNPHTLACAGSLAEKDGRRDDAFALYRRVLEVDANDVTALCWFGVKLQEQGDLDAAFRAFLRCTTAHPQYAPGWCNVGGVCIARGCAEDAEAAYRRAVELDPTWAAGHQGLVWLFTSRGDEAKRQAAIRAWAAACPEHPVAAHLALALDGAHATARCPATFVAALFDDFARDYDRVLAGLGTNIATLFAAMWNAAGITARNVLDLGCGTGSASGWLRAEGRRLVGVDLSRGMLARAASASLHDELHCADAMQFLAATTDRFDAIVLADVVPYFGDLEPLLAAVAARLTAGGHVLLSFEASPTTGCVLASTGRFQHDPEAVRGAAAQGKLEVVELHGCVLRQEGGRPVPGGCVLLRSPDR